MATDPHDLEGRAVVDANGHRVGRVKLVYVDPDTMTLQWGLVRTGFLGKPVVVPLVQAAGDGTNVQIPHTREQIRLSPRVNARSGHLTEAEEQQLAHHYGLRYTREASPSGLVEPLQGTPREARTHTPPPSTSEASMVRSEERLALRLTNRPASRVRLIKRMVSQPASTTVAVRREELRIERGPIGELEGQELQVHELVPVTRLLTLLRQEPVVGRRVEPVETVRLAKEVRVEQQTVHAEVRREHVAVERVAAGERRQ